MANDEIQKTRWVVGLDLRPHSHGAINFAAWLHAHDRRGKLELEGLHVVDSALFDLPSTGARAEILGGAKRAALTSLEARSAREAFAHVDVIEASDVVDTLAAAGGLANVAGVIIGRRAGEENRSLVRLGKVARRLLRRLEAPLFVVPPDLEPAHVGPGPVLCAIDLDDNGVAVAGLGRSLADMLGRELRLIHVIEHGDPIGLSYLPEGTWDHLQDRRHEHGRAALARWREEHGIEAPTVISHGQVVEQVISGARKLDACMILSGSRQLSLAQRMWMSSTGSTLAAASHLPVGIVPAS